MYGSRSYGSSAYGGLSKQSPIVVFSPTVFSIHATIIPPTFETVEFSDNLHITASLKAPTIVAVEKAIVIKVNNVDISDQVSFNSLSVSNNLYSEPNNAFFEIIKSSTKSYTPAAGDTIVIEDTGVKVFAGILIKISKEMMAFSERYSLEFKDWTEELSTLLVAQTYTNYTVTDIIADIFSTHTDYDITNAVDSTVINQLVSDNISISNALDKLAELTNKYWYVSPDKEIYFFADNGIQSPFDLDDTSGNYDYSSLEIEENLTQIRNKVTIKGKGIAAVTVQDLTSQGVYGIREYYERDDDIDATNEATQKANAILASYKDSIKIANFQTKTVGLRAGQQIEVVSALRGINETLNIETVNLN
ncbi:MAG: hypothetical protein RBQ97_08400, partial [Acholeplasma sp.]|nr:hypothetical protein [Acholeplasma sp.]